MRVNSRLQRHTVRLRGLRTRDVVFPERFTGRTAGATSHPALYTASAGMSETAPESWDPLRRPPEPHCNPEIPLLARDR
jgi:hypothetical protein